jgi:hypothetical protein
MTLPSVCGNWGTHSETGVGRRTVCRRPSCSIPDRVRDLRQVKDNLVKLWDTSSWVTARYIVRSQNTVTRVAWNDNGNWLTASRDQLIRFTISVREGLVAEKDNKGDKFGVASSMQVGLCLGGGRYVLYWNIGAKGSRNPLPSSRTTWQFGICNAFLLGTCWRLVRTIGKPLLGP